MKVMNNNTTDAGDLCGEGGLRERTEGERSPTRDDRVDRDCDRYRDKGECCGGDDGHRGGGDCDDLVGDEDSDADDRKMKATAAIIRKGRPNHLVSAPAFHSASGATLKHSNANLMRRGSLTLSVSSAAQEGTISSIVSDSPTSSLSDGDENDPYSISSMSRDDDDGDEEGDSLLDLNLPPRNQNGTASGSGHHWRVGGRPRLPASGAPSSTPPGSSKSSGDDDDDEEEEEERGRRLRLASCGRSRLPASGASLPIPPGSSMSSGDDDDEEKEEEEEDGRGCDIHQSHGWGRRRGGVSFADSARASRFGDAEGGDGDDRKGKRRRSYSTDSNTGGASAGRGSGERRGSGGGRGRGVGLQRARSVRRLADGALEASEVRRSFALNLSDRNDGVSVGTGGSGGEDRNGKSSCSKDDNKRECPCTRCCSSFSWIRRLLDAANNRFVANAGRGAARRSKSSIATQPDQYCIPPPVEGGTLLGSVYAAVGGGRSDDFVVWIYAASFLRVMLFFLLVYFALVLLFAWLVVALETRSGGRCGISPDPAVFVDNRVWDFAARYELAFELSWTTFTTVGYGIVSPPGDEVNCYPLRFSCALFAYLGMLFHALSSAIVFSKLERLLTRASVTFGSCMCVQFEAPKDSGKRKSNPLRMSGNFCSIPFDINAAVHAASASREKVSYPFVEIRIVNDHANNRNRAIWNATVSAMVQLPDMDAAAHVDSTSISKNGSNDSQLMFREYITPITVAPASHDHHKHAGGGDTSKTSSSSSSLQWGKSMRQLPLFRGKKPQSNEQHLDEGSMSLSSKGSKLDDSFCSQSSDSLKCRFERWKSNAHLSTSEQVEVDDNNHLKISGSRRGRRERQTSQLHLFASDQAGGPKGNENGGLLQASVPIVTIQEGDSGTGGGGDATSMAYYPLNLEPSSHPYFARVWYVRHVLDQNSPLLKLSVREKIRIDGGWDPTRRGYEDVLSALVAFRRLRVALRGTSCVSTSIVFAQKVYSHEDMYVGWQFGQTFYKIEQGWMSNVRGWFGKKVKKSRDDGEEGTKKQKKEVKLKLDSRLIHDITPQPGRNYEPIEDRTARLRSEN